MTEEDKERMLQFEKERLLGSIDRYHKLLDEIKETRKQLLKELQCKKDELDHIYQQELTNYRRKAEEKVDVSDLYRSEKQILITKIWKCTTIDEIDELLQTNLNPLLRYIQEASND